MMTRKTKQELIAEIITLLEKRIEVAEEISPPVIAITQNQPVEMLTIGSKWIDYDRLFVKWDGRPMNNGTPYLWLRELCEKNNLRFCDVHSFRHAHAYILINAGVDVATVSADLGHSNSMTTLSIYTHEFQDAQARTSDIVANALDFSKKKESAVS